MFRDLGVCSTHKPVILAMGREKAAKGIDNYLKTNEW
jgi:hypothetical protein